MPYLQAVPDPRQASGRHHPLAAMLAGCDSLLAISEWGRAPHAGAPLAQRLGFTQERTPCVATLHRVFKRLDVVAFERAVGSWTAAASTALSEAAGPATVAIDGKVLHGSRQATVPAVHRLGAVGQDLGVVLAQTPVAPESDEVRALPALLAGVVLDGRVLTLAAGFTERPVADAMLAKGGTS
jgi:hypothetical protein